MILLSNLFYEKFWWFHGKDLSLLGKKWMRGERYLFPGGQEDGHRWKIALESVVTGPQVCKPRTLFRGALRWAGIGLSSDPASLSGWGQPIGSTVLPKGTDKSRGTAARSARQPCFRKQRSECCLSTAVAAVRPCSLWLLLGCFTNHSPPSLSAPVLLTSLLLRGHVECSPASWPLC